jgi:hypothetical protein
MFANLKQLRETNLEEKEVRINYYSAAKVITYAIIKIPRRNER